MQPVPQRTLSLEHGWDKEEGKTFSLNGIVTETFHEHQFRGFMFTFSTRQSKKSAPVGPNVPSCSGTGDEGLLLRGCCSSTLAGESCYPLLLVRCLPGQARAESSEPGLSSARLRSTEADTHPAQPRTKPSSRCFTTLLCRKFRDHRGL